MQGYGTALGVITHLFETGFLERAYYTQSTPYHQGSRYHHPVCLAAHRLRYPSIA
jgi:methylthioribose-1-phosphate isomerase